jgi:hypothetical protein
MLALVQVCFTLHLMDHWSTWMQYGCKVCIDSSMASNASSFMITWIIFKNHFWEVRLTQNRETMALRNLTTINLLYVYHVWEIPRVFIEISFGWGPRHMWLHTTLKGMWPHCMILKVSCNSLLTLLFDTKQLTSSNNVMVWLLACVWSGPHKGLMWSFQEKTKYSCSHQSLGSFSSLSG